MNALVPVSQSGGSFALVPQNLNEAMELARMMAANDILPQHFKNKPAHCLMVIEQAGRWRMSPFQVAMGTSLIQGKLMTEGKIIAAAVNTQPGMKGRLNYSYAGAGDDRTVTVFGTLVGETEPRTVDVRVKDARTANKVWQTQTDQQLAYHGARVWARRHTPEVILGVYAPEEFDTIEGAPQPQQRIAAPREPIRQLTTSEAIGDEIPALAEPPPPEPAALSVLKRRLAACTDAACVTEADEWWRNALAKAEAAGKIVPHMVRQAATDMLAERLGEFPAPPVEHDDMADGL